MRIGAILHNNDTSWSQLREVIQTMDAGAWDSVWLFDHLVPPLEIHDERAPCLEAWSLLAAFAVATERLRFGAAVTAVLFRNPALVAKMAATIDEVSGGRLELGIGAGWHEREHQAYGLPFPSGPDRADHLEEACRVIKLLFTATTPTTHHGAHYQLEDAPFAPRCVQRPHVPIWVGGGGERRTLRTAALYADAMNVSGPPRVVRRKIEVLERHCEDVGRDPGEILHTVHLPVGLVEDPGRARRIREVWGAAYSEEEREQFMAIGSAAHIRSVVAAYADLGVEAILFEGLPNRPALYAELDEQVVRHL